MTQLQILQEIEQLPLNERLHIIAKVALSARREVAGTSEGESSSMSRLHGAIRGQGPAPNDEECDQIRYEYLMEKYG